MLYYPLSTKEFTFENIFSTESISPPAFYPIRDYGINYFHVLPEVNQINAIILYASPPKYEVNVGSKFLLQINERLLSDENLIFIKEGIYGYTKTIYLNKSNFSLLFFNEKDLKVAILKSKTSLPTKNLEKYINNFALISENECVSFNKLDINIQTDSSEFISYIKKDKKFNHFKGFIYGLTCANYDRSGQSSSAFKKAHREFINQFAEFKNRFSQNEGFIGYSKSRGLNRVDTLKNLLTTISILEVEYRKIIQEEEISKTELIKILFDNFRTVESLEVADKYINSKIIDDEIYGTDEYSKVKNAIISKVGLNNVFNMFSELRNQIQTFASNTDKERIKSLETLDVQIKLKLNSIENNFLKSIAQNNSIESIALENIEYDFERNEIYLKGQFGNVTSEEIRNFNDISNKVLYYSLQGKNADKSVVMKIVEDAGSHFSRSSKATNLFQYLNHQIDEYSIDKVTNPVLKNFVAFIFNHDSLEKLENFIINKNIQEGWMAFSFWGALNGFSNLSGNFTNAIFSHTGEKVQNYLDTYLKNYIFKLNDNETENQINEVKEEISTYNVSLENAVNEFFYKYIYNVYKLSKDQFNQIYTIKEKEKFYQEVKQKFSMNKKNAEKLFNCIKRNFESPELFS